MEPMILGLGPLFDSEILGFLVDVNGKKESWAYRNGSYLWENKAKISVTDPVKLSSGLPVAVLHSSQTGSSGEIVLISFIGNAKTRSFGQPTWGLTTGNGAFDLPDGARMMLASTVMADRNGKKYSGCINPDVMVDPGKPGEEDPVMKAAVEWINGKNW
jgi:carboxyl-terminal processing protease